MIIRTNNSKCNFQYPEAKTTLMDRGTQLLMKDNLLDEDAYKASQKQEESNQKKLNRFGE